MREWDSERFDSLEPSDEHLMAYVDGELTPRRHAEIEDDLISCPELRSEVEAYEQLAQLCNDAQIDEPSEVKWQAVLESVDASASSRPTPGKDHRRQLPRWALTLTGAAAAVLVSILVLRFAGNNDEIPERRPRATIQAEPDKKGTIAQPSDGFNEFEPFALVSASNVEINSIDAHDANAVVVGELPFAGSMELIATGNVAIDRVEAFPGDGMMPNFVLTEEGSPMVVVPIPDEMARR